jgi:MFS family permease
MPKGFYLLIAAQFFSALADHALLFVSIALLEVHGIAGWWAPLLRFFFVASYVALAPFVGPLTDAVSKPRLMATTNAAKALGVFAMLATVHPALAFGFIGLASAFYTPAKYGLVTELVKADRLVAANGWIEVSAVGAVLLGAALGGFLVSGQLRPLNDGLNATLGAMFPGVIEPVPYLFSLLVLLAFYTVAGLLNTWIPASGERHPHPGVDPYRLMRDFYGASRTLWRDREGGMSLAITTVLWSAAATLQFVVLRWSVDVLALPLSQAAYLQGTVAVGVVLGATMAGRSVRLDSAYRVMPIGVLLGLLVLAATWVDRVLFAVPLLLAVGGLGGLLLVPMNALLQHRGYRLLSSGRSIAVQAFNENLSVLVSLGLYAAVLAAGAPIVNVLAGIGSTVAVVFLLLLLRWRHTAAKDHRWSAPESLGGQAREHPRRGARADR